MSKAQIKGRLEAIIDLSEIGPFLDMPLKRYSSGMTMRLAFAIATQIETELLIVDEVMAVGDVVFQKKSTEHLALKSRQGTTVLFVSHNLGLINSLCTRAIWLDEGRLVMEGPSKSVTRAYLEMESQGDTEVELTQGTFSSDEFRFHRIAVKSSLNVTTPIEIELSYEAKRRFEKLEISIEIFNHEGVRVCSLRRSGGGVRGVSQGRHEAQVKIPPLFLVPGSYFLDLVAHIPNIDTLVQHSQAIRFEVEEMGSTMTAYRPGSYGVVFLNAPWVEKSASATVRNELDEQYLPRN
jgi:lipopolysaccharide transport system ATP-binding protein